METAKIVKLTQIRVPKLLRVTFNAAEFGEAGNAWISDLPVFSRMTNKEGTKFQSKNPKKTEKKLSF